VATRGARILRPKATHCTASATRRIACASELALQPQTFWYSSSSNFLKTPISTSCRLPPMVLLAVSKGVLESRWQCSISSPPAHSSFTSAQYLELRRPTAQPYASFVQWKVKNGRRPTYYCELCQVHIDSSLADSSIAESLGVEDDILRAHCRSNGHKSLVLQIHAVKSSTLRTLCAKQQLRMEQFCGTTSVMEQRQSLVRCKLYWLLAVAQLSRMEGKLRLLVGKHM
jgi:hypothetical protein